MAQLQITFPPPQEPLANYSYEDLAEGTGKVIYYGISSETSAAVDYHLVSSALYSSEISKDVTSNGTTTLDFDLAPFNLPRTAKGTAYFSAGGVAGASATTTLKVQVKKWDGSSETNISSEITTPTLSNAQDMFLLELPLTQTHFSKGDILRLTVKLVATSGGNACKVGHDPKDRTLDSLPSSVMEFHMSFRIEG
jgi:hypothetical protein